MFLFVSKRFKVTHQKDIQKCSDGGNHSQFSD